MPSLALHEGIALFVPVNGDGKDVQRLIVVVDFRTPLWDTSAACASLHLHHDRPKVLSMTFHQLLCTWCIFSLKPALLDTVPQAMCRAAPGHRLVHVVAEGVPVTHPHAQPCT